MAVFTDALRGAGPALAAEAAASSEAAAEEEEYRIQKVNRPGDAVGR
ncbi:hypothetical protein NKI86_03255 [Mesorhizobium sp. M0320]